MENNFVQCEREAISFRIQRKDFALPATLLILFLSFTAISVKAFYKRPLLAQRYHHTITESAPSPVWILDSTVSKVNFYHMVTTCDGKNTVFLKFENKNKFDVKVTWKEKFLTQQLGFVDGFEGEKQLEIKSEETLMPSSCNDSKKQFIVFPQQVSPAYMAIVLDFGFKEIIVTELREDNKGKD